jgi:hypothetical protein
VVQRAWWPELTEWKIFLLTAGLGFVGVVVGAPCTPATPRDTVRHFYRRTRPFGFCGPFWSDLTAADQSAWRKEHRHDQIALPFALLGQITLFLLPMQVVLHAWGDFWKTVPWFVVAAFGMYWFWWRNLPASEPEVNATATIRAKAELNAGSFH